MTNITHIPLNRLIAWEGNARRTMSEEGIAELAASIKAHGLLQSLVVIEDGNNYAVVAGNRRLIALQKLVETGELKDTHEIPCQIVDSAAAAEANLAENTIREAMHPADQFEAFRALFEQGKSEADIAAAFGVTETTVRQRMKLGQVSPRILQAYRDEELSLEEVMAFTLTEDHERQEHILSELESWQGAREIRRVLTQDEIPATDRRVRFVTLKAYEKAGGQVKRDLFAEDDNAIFVTDLSLLDRLLADKLERTAKPVRKEGWKWVDVRASFGWSDKREFDEIEGELPGALAEEAQKLQDEWEIIEDSDEQPHIDRCDAIRARLEEVEAAREFTPEQKATAGAVVSISENGKTEILRGLVKPEDLPDAEADPSEENGEAIPGAKAEKPPAEFSAGLIEDLTAQRSAAISAMLASDPSAALAAVVHAMALNVFYPAGSFNTCLQMTVKEQSFRKVEGSTALAQIAEVRKKWDGLRPETEDDLWSWCLQQDQQTLLDLMAFCAACTVDAIQTKQGRPGNARLQHADQLAAEVQLDMTRYFSTTAENYFSRIAKPQIVQALQEVDATLPSGSMKKADIAKYAERSIAGKDWLPKPLRHAA